VTLLLCLFFAQIRFVSFIFRPNKGLIPLMDPIYLSSLLKVDRLFLTLLLTPYKALLTHYKAAEYAKKSHC
jgi:hypothetical protein